MAYIGAGLDDDLEKAKTISMACDTMTGNGSASTLTITASKAPATVNNVSVYFDGVAQRPTTDYFLTGNVVTFTTPPENNVKVICISYVDEYKGQLCDNSVTADSIEDSCITDAKIVGMSASKLTGALPAGDGSALTGIPSPVLQASTDPVITTNPADGVGTAYMNSASGEMFICTDATADANVWTNVGGGSGNIEPYIFHFTGSTYGFVAGGNTTTASYATLLQSIDKFAFAGSGVSTSGHGTLTSARQESASSSSGTHGFTAGGINGSGTISNVDTFAFAGSSVTATDHGNLLYGSTKQRGHSSVTHGFYSGDNNGSQSPAPIVKYPFSTASDLTDHGDLTNSSWYDHAVFSGPNDGFIAGGYRGAPNSGDTDKVNKFSYTSNVMSTDHGTLSAIWRHGVGVSTETHGYICTGENALPGTAWPTTDIQQFSYATSNTISSHGDLNVGLYRSAAASENTHGYIFGGAGNPWPGGKDSIEKFSYTSNVLATDHGDLSQGYAIMGGGYQV